MKCVFWRHRWSFWEEYGKTNIVNRRNGGVLGYVFIQKRTCHRCGLVQYKHDRIMADGE